MKTTRGSILAKVNNAIDGGIINDIFIHVRNYVVCSLILVAGFYAKDNPRNLLPLGTKADVVAGFITIAFGFLLILINLYDGIYKLSKYKRHFLLDILLLVIYLFVTLRIFEIIWNFRSAF
jgi:hypothetical protein